MPRPPISVLVHTYNEADQIAECLRSVAWADEIYLLDSFSTDRTVEIARETIPSLHVEQRVSLGSAAQKNYGMDRASHDWILVIDADERVTAELREEIIETLSGSPRNWAYSIGRRNFILGEELRFSGLQRDRVTRLFHRKHARYPNRRVHADLVVDGTLGRLREKYLHYYVRSLDHFGEKMTRYGTWGAAQLFLDGRRASRYQMLTHPVIRFLRDYILNLGFLDGTIGMLSVWMHAYYTFWKYAKLWEYCQLERAGKPVPLPALDLEAERWLRPWEHRRDQALNVATESQEAATEADSIATKIVS